MSYIIDRRISCPNLGKIWKQKFREIQTWWSCVFFKEIEPHNQMEKNRSGIKVLRLTANVMEEKQNQKSKDKN